MSPKIEISADTLIAVLHLLDWQRESKSFIDSDLAGGRRIAAEIVPALINAGYIQVDDWKVDYS